jgi:ligand-binding SRPBCC domain-containing protein
MKVYSLKTEQFVNASIEECWSFFSNPKNLQKITPSDMGFEITDFDEKSMYAGQIIQYKVSPLFGIKLGWMTVITVVKDQSYFVDEQRFGPYTLWHHKHFLKEIPGGVEMEDIVDYNVPMGILGQMVHPFLVKPKLKEIFDYRREKLIELFGEFKEQ